MDDDGVGRIAINVHGQVAEAVRLKGEISSGQAGAHLKRARPAVQADVQPTGALVVLDDVGSTASAARVAEGDVSASSRDLENVRAIVAAGQKVVVVAAEPGERQRLGKIGYSPVAELKLPQAAGDRADRKS